MLAESNRSDGSSKRVKSPPAEHKYHSLLELFSAMDYAQLTTWIESHDPAEAGYLEATHVLWCRTCIDDVMAGKLSPREVPMFDNLDEYFAT